MDPFLISTPIIFRYWILFHIYFACSQLFRTCSATKVLQWKYSCVNFPSKREAFLCGFLVFIKNLNNLCKHKRRNIHPMIWYAEKSHLFISDKKSSAGVEMLMIDHKFTLLRKTGLYSNLYICNNALNKFSFWYFRYKRRQLEGHFRIVLQLKPLQATTKGSIATTAAQCQSKHSNSIGW